MEQRTPSALLRPLPALAYPAIGAVLAGASALLVLWMADEPLLSPIFNGILGGGVVAGAFVGGLVALYRRFDRSEHTGGLATATVLSAVPLLLVGLGIGALAEGPTAADRTMILRMIVGVTGWWFCVLVGGIAGARGKRWGAWLQATVVGVPLVVLAVGAVIAIALRPIAPGELWHDWQGSRRVAAAILLPVGGLGLLISVAMGDRGCTLLTGAFSALLMGGAFAGEWLGRPAGHPIAGAFVGGMAVVALASVCLWLASRRDSGPPGSTIQPEARAKPTADP